jgi:hypothetical protein
VSRITDPGTRLRTKYVAKHEQIGSEKQNCKQHPRAAKMPIYQTCPEEDDETFNMR